MAGLVARCLGGFAVVAISFAVTLYFITPDEPVVVPAHLVQPPPFDEKLYLAVNPDVAAAIQRREFRSGREHYLLAGRAEKRSGAFVPPEWNEADYLKRNPDVAGAVASGIFISGYHHYLAAGKAEKRLGGFPPVSTAAKS